MKRPAMVLVLMVVLCAASLPRETGSPDESQNIPRKPLVFKFQATLQGIKGEYGRAVDIAENSSFYVRDQAGLYRWSMAGRFGAVKNMEIPVQFWLSWSLPGLKEENVESSFSLKIGDKPKLVPEDVKALVAYASIERTGAGQEEQAADTLDRGHPAWLVLESYIISLKTNDFKLFQSCFVPKSGTGLAAIGKNALASYRKAFLPKYRKLDINEVKIIILGRGDDRLEYSVLTASDEVIDVPHLKKGTFVNLRATTWKIDW
jgi:hypothetical protein